MASATINNINRREFLAVSAALFSCGALGITPKKNEQQLVVGCFTNTNGEALPTDFGTHRGPKDLSKGLYTLTFNNVTGQLSPAKLAAEISNPVNLIMHPNRKLVYACRGQNSRIDGQNLITAFAIQGNAIKRLNTVRSGGQGPTVGCVTKNGSTLLTTHFASNSIVSIALLPDGSLGKQISIIGNPEFSSTIAMAAPGSLAHKLNSIDESEVGKPHDVTLSRNQRFAIATEIIANRLRILKFNRQTGSFTPYKIAEDSPGAGPRHIAWHPSYRFLYTSGEANSSISAWAWQEASGDLTCIQNIASLPNKFKGKNHPADIVVHPSGKFVYVTNRGAGTLAGYKIDQQSGKLTAIQHTPLSSPSCWSMVFDASGEWALVAEQIGDKVTVYSVNSHTGQLNTTGNFAKVVLPTCLRWA